MEPIENYQKDELTISPAKANIYSFLFFIPVGIVIGLPYYLLWKDDLNAAFINFFFPDKISSVDLLAPLSIIIFIISGMVAHEFIHAVTLSRYTKQGFKSIKIGVSWKILTPYCHCKEPLLIKQYIAGSIMPAILLGFIPPLIALLTGNSILFIFGIVFTLAATGDFMIIILLRKENKENLVQDHPSKLGCYIYRKLK